MTIRQTYESMEDFAREIKKAKVQRAFFKIDTSQQEIAIPVSAPTEDGTTETKNVRGIRIVSTLVVTAMSPTELEEKQTQLEKQMILAGIPVQYVFEAPIAAKDCATNADFEIYNKELADAKENVLGQLMNFATVVLFPGSVGPVVTPE